MVDIYLSSPGIPTSRCSLKQVATLTVDHILHAIKSSIISGIVLDIYGPDFVAQSPSIQGNTHRTPRTLQPTPYTIHRTPYIARHIQHSTKYDISDTWDYRPDTRRHTLSGQNQRKNTVYLVPRSGTGYSILPSNSLLHSSCIYISSMYVPVYVLPPR